MAFFADDCAAVSAAVRASPRQGLLALAMGAAVLKTPADVLQFWFGRAFYASAEAPFLSGYRNYVEEDRFPKWFQQKDALFDAAQVGSGALVAAVASGAVDADIAWRGPRGALAKLIVLDRFARVAGRGTAAAYSHGAAAAELATSMTRYGVGGESAWFDECLSPLERFFVVVALSRAEDEDSSLRHSELAGDVCAGSMDDDLDDFFRKLPGFPHERRQCIRRFGRFPGRNAILGRASTRQEVDWLRNCPRWARQPEACALLDCGGRGLAHPARYVLALGMRAFVDVGVPDRAAFLWLRDARALPFDQLPILVPWAAGERCTLDAVAARAAADPSAVIAESGAMIRHAARLTHLDGRDAAERAAADMVACAVADARRPLAAACFAAQPRQALNAFAAGPLAALARRLERLLARGAAAAFVAGGAQPTYADAVVVELLDSAADKCGGAAALEARIAAPLLTALWARLSALAPVRRYRASPGAAPPPDDDAVRQVCETLELPLPPYLA
ncbi:hypothetical protein M885DRAFT_626828 [Pelagophyceae sp. CCMP2097]|nr:hypothetical protein M885DRAFT_626828 [Pelagophyceae sp. CCMP2097]